MAEKPKTNPPKKKTWWCLQRHDEFKVVQADERPENEEVAGERMPATHGPYATREAAQERADALYARTLKGIAERNA